MKSISDIEAERKRQIVDEGFDAFHDNEHVYGELAMAAACFAAPDRIYVYDDDSSGFRFIDPWPWDSRWDKRENCPEYYGPRESISIKHRRDLLIKAGALIAAEIDRIDRLAASGQEFLP